MTTEEENVLDIQLIFYLYFIFGFYNLSNLFDDEIINIFFNLLK